MPVKCLERASVEMRFAAAEQPYDPEAERDAGDRREGGADRRVADALPVDQKDDRAEGDGADHRADEGADDALPEAIRQEDGEVPEGDAHRQEDQESHQSRPSLIAVVLCAAGRVSPAARRSVCVARPTPG